MMVTKGLTKATTRWTQPPDKNAINSVAPFPVCMSRSGSYTRKTYIANYVCQTLYTLLQHYLEATVQYG